ncbi:MAG: Twin-arginine translocation pathway signal [Proteobacteria bacterium]|nr:Twin-arginine translocation pathway signal [Pseudomonadota bacterium]
MNHNDSTKRAGVPCVGQITRRTFLKYSAGTVGAISLGSLTFGCGGGSSDSGAAAIASYPIDPNVKTTLDRMLSFPASLPGLNASQLREVAQYAKYGYGNWTFGSPLPLKQRPTDIMPAGYSVPTRKTKLLNFFAFTDIHITDKEAPNQLTYIQKLDPGSYNNTSIYSPVMMCTTHVLDAAMQTANALHQQDPFDFGISLGDTCNNTSYNELRWYIDVIDGKVITPSSGDHLGADSIDYQKPYQAVGLDKSIAWYQALGNHDHFYIGSFPVDGYPAYGLRNSYLADSVWAVGDVLALLPTTFPILIDLASMLTKPSYYMGVLDGASPYGEVIDSGPASDPAFAAGAPKVTADANRRSLVRSGWVQEFFNTTSNPVGHGFNLVDPALASDGFACYSFVPNAKVPLKVIVLDDTRSEYDGATDIHGHGYLDAKRWTWLQAELDKGQAANQLMIIAAHVPIGVAAIGALTEWWAPVLPANPTTAPQYVNVPAQYQNAVTLTDLVAKLQSCPNLLMWVAGHRHLNTVKAFPSADKAKPEQGFWQVETSSLRDWPQQFRTFQIYLNSDYTVSIVTVNVDPSVAAGTPAATSRKYAIATQQIVQNNVQLSNPNYANLKGVATGLALPTMDPTRVQDNSGTPDPTIQFVDLSNAPIPVPYNGSYNAELFKQLSPAMINALKAMFP